MQFGRTNHPNTALCKPDWTRKSRWLCTNLPRIQGQVSDCPCHANPQENMKSKMKPDLCHWVAWFLIWIFLFTLVGCGARPASTPAPSETETMITHPVVPIQPVSIP